MQDVCYKRKEVFLPAILKEIFPLHLWESLQSPIFQCAEEIRLHTGRLVSVSIGNENRLTDIILNEDEMKDILLRLCSGSLYAYHDSIREGYLTLHEGIRVGICGSIATENGKAVGVDHVSGLIFRIPHTVSYKNTELLKLLKSFHGTRGILIYSPPGVGKTTLLRNLAISASEGSSAFRTVVVDSRKEFGSFPDAKKNLLDVLDGYPKALGMEIAVRSLGAQLIICDEIGNMQDANAVRMCANCGVPLVASAHAGYLEELFLRPAIRLLHKNRVFGAYVGLFRTENGKRMQKLTLWEDANADY